MNINAITSYSQPNLLQAKKQENAPAFKGFNTKTYEYVKPTVVGKGAKFTALCVLYALGLDVVNDKIMKMRKEFSKDYMSDIDKQRNYAKFQFENSLLDGLPENLLADGINLMNGRINMKDNAVINDGRYSKASMEEYLACDEGGKASVEFEYIPKNDLVSAKSDLGLQLVPPKVQFLADLLTEKGVETKLLTNYKGLRSAEFIKDGNRELVFTQGKDLADRRQLCDVMLNKLKNID